MAAILAIWVGATATASAHAGYAAIVVDADTGRVLHAHNADSRNFPASLTKMMTLFLAFEALENGTLALDQRLVVSRRAAGQPASKLGLKRGDTISVNEAISALAIKSANDVATVIAETLGGTEIKFAQMMTRRARELGMKRTSFRNASGLPNRRQLSTARDMAILARALIERFPNYYGFFAQPSFRYNGKTFRNHNTLLENYDGADGIKTGYIRASGFNLVASAERDGIRLIGVVFGGRTADRRDRQMQRLLNRSWARARAASTIAARPVPKPPVPGTDAATEVALAKTTAPVPEKLAVPARRKARPARINQPLPTTALPKAPTNWGIQIGAFSGYTDAHIAASNVARQLPNLPVTTSLNIQPVDQSADTLFRAQLIGMAEKLARDSCQELISNGQACVVVTPQGGELAGLPSR